MAHGYHDGHDAGTFLQRPHAPDGPYWNLRGNGGMLSTASDMYRFYRALMSDGPLLKPASRDLFFHPDQPEVLAGSDMTFFFFYSRYPGARIDAILVSNSTDYAAEKARGELDAALGIAPSARRPARWYARWRAARARDHSSGHTGGARGAEVPPRVSRPRPGRDAAFSSGRGDPRCERSPYPSGTHGKFRGDARRSRRAHTG